MSRDADVHECTDMLVAIGFTPSSAARAISACGANVERCVDFLSSDAGGAENDESPPPLAPPPPPPPRVPPHIASRSDAASTPCHGGDAALVPHHGGGSAASTDVPRDPALEETRLQIMSMGFDDHIATQAVYHFGPDAEAALNWILTGMSVSGLNRRAAGKPLASTAAALPTQAPAFPIDDALLDILETQFAMHRAVWLRDHDALREYCRHARLVNARDARGCTPLQLAHRLGYEDIINFLLAHGADPRAQNAHGWSVLQEAALKRQYAIVLDMYLHQIQLQSAEWEASLPALVAALERMPDFYMEIKWDISSWVPFLARMAPSDTFQIYKRGGRLRFDSNANVQSAQSAPRRISFLFSSEHGLGAASGAGHGSGGSSIESLSRSVFLVDFEGGYFEDALLKFRNPPFELVEREVAHMCTSEVGKSEILCDRAQYKTKTSLFGGQKEERILDQWDCKLGEIGGLRFQIVKKHSDNGGGVGVDEQGGGALPSMEEYFDQAAAQAAALVRSADVVSVDREIEAGVWLCEQYPLSRESIATIFDIVAPASPDLARVKQIFTTPMPPGFPVRLEIPVMPAVTACVAFTVFRAETCDASLFEIPAAFRQRM